MKFELIPITKIDSYEVSNKTVYDIEVENDHSFCVDNNIAVHNSACLTRKMTGVGYGSLSCVIECSHTAHGLKSDDKRLGLICSDGGCKTPGDVCKAFCGGSDFVMLGGYFAGAEECEGEWTYEINTTKTKKSFKFYGMSSHYAQEKHAEGKKDYRASEGDVIEVTYKGPVDGLIQELFGGIRSCCAYIGASNIKEMNKCAHFCRIR